MLESGDALGVATIYHDLTGETIKRWEEGVTSPEIDRSLALKLRALFSSKSSDLRSNQANTACLLCGIEAEAEDRFVSALASGLKRPDVWERYEQEAEFCVRHIESLCERAALDVKDRVLKREIDLLRSLEGELEEYMRKTDFRFRDEPMGEEGDSWRRALLKINS